MKRLSTSHKLKLKTKLLKIKEHPLLFIGIALIAILGGILLLQQVLKKPTSAAWWNGDYKYRTAYSFTATSAVSSSRKVKLDIDTATLITATKMHSDCDDVRFTDGNGKVLDYYIDTATADCNNASTDFYVKFDSIASGGNLVYVYYGNSSTSRSDLGGRKNLFFSDNMSDNGLQAYWSFNESAANGCSGGTNDSCDSAYANDGAWQADATTTTTAKLGGRATTFDGFGDYIAVPNSTNLNPSSAISFGAWLRPTANGSTSYYTPLIKAFVGSGGGNEQYFIQKVGGADSNTGKLYIGIKAGGSMAYASSTSASDWANMLNTWTHVMGTYDGANLKLYMNGVLVTTTAKTGALNTDTQALGIGGESTGVFTKYLGQIDDVAIYNRALTDLEISNLYNGGNGREVTVSEFVPSSGPTASSEETTPGPIAWWKFDEGQGQTVNDNTTHNSDGTLGVNSSSASDDPTWKQESECVVGKCLYFDGGDYVTAPDPALGSFTGSNTSLSAWLKHTASGEDVFFMNRTNFAGSTGVEIYLDSSGYLRARGSSGTEVTSNTIVPLNSWTHVEIVYSGTTVSIYINGKLDKTGTIATVAASTDIMYVGSYYANTSYAFNGFMDDVKIYPYARSAAEVKADYSSGAAVLGLSDQKDYLSDGLVGYWKMDETSGNMSDSSGNSTTLTDTNTVVFAGGKFGNGGDFERTSSEYQYAADNTPLSLTGSTVLSAWIKPESVTASTSFNIIGKWDGSNESYLLQQFGDEIRMYIDSSSNYQTTTARNLAAASWYHVVGVYDAASATVKIYVNGVETASTTTGTIPTSIADDAGRFHIGAEDSTTTAANFYDGVIDDARVYNRALSADDIRNLYAWSPGPVGYWNFDEGQGQSTADISGSGNTGTVGSTSGSEASDPTWVTGKYGKALLFDGTDDIVTLTNGTNSQFPASNDYTIQAWVYITSTSGCPGSGVPCNPFYAQSDSTNDGIIAYVAETSAVAVRENSNGRTGATTTTTGSWHHIAVVRSGNGASLTSYDNGVPTALSAVNSGISTSAAPVIGGSSGFSQYFHGMIDEVKVYNYGRTNSQIFEDMNAGHPLGDSPSGSQVAYWPLDEQQGQTTNNKSIGGSALNGTLGATSGSSTDDPTWKTRTNCKVNGCLSFDGQHISDYVTLNSTNITGLTNYTYTMWVYFNNLTVTYDAGLLAMGSGGGVGQIITLDPSTGFQFSSYYGSGALASITANTLPSTGTWYHLAAVRDTSTSKIRLYVDSKLAAEGTITTSAPGYSSAFRIGDNGSAINAPDGYIDEVKIYNSALTVDQIKTDMNAGLATSYSVLGTSEASTLTSGEGNPPTLDFNFNENTGQSANDTSGNGRTGTLGTTSSSESTDPTWKSVTGQPSYGNGIGGTALNFDGSNDIVSHTPISTLTTSFTVEAWVKRDPAQNGSQTVIYKSGTASNFWYIATTGTLGFTEDFVQSTTGGTIPANTWTHIAVVKSTDSGTNLFLYVNGVLVSSGSHGTVVAPSGTAYIGGTNSSNQFLGQIDGFKIYDYARSASQIAYDYNRGDPVGQWKFDECQGSTAYDASGKGNNGTITIGASGTQASAGTCSTSSTAWGNGASGKYSSALNFDGTDDYVTITSNQALNDIANTGNSVTYASWIYLADTSASYIVFSKMHSVNNQRLYGIYTDSSAKVGFSVTDATTTDTYSTSASVVSAGAWYHLAVTHTYGSGSSTKVYINGQLVPGSWISGTGDRSTNSSNTNPLNIGYQQHPVGAYFKGKIDNLQIYNYSLSAAQIKRLYNEDFGVRFGQ